MPRHLESRLQIACKRWFDLQYPKIARLCFSVPNGGFRSAVEAQFLKAEGSTAGVSDMIMLIGSAAGKYSSLCIEFKAGTGKQTELQRTWQQLAEQHGNKYVVCRSFDEFRNEIETYLKY